MSALPLSKPENISNLLHMDQEYAAPSVVARSVLQRDWNGARERALKDPEGFWADYADRVRMVTALDQGPRVGRRPSPVVHRRQDQHHHQRARPPRQLRERAIAPPSSGSAKTAPSASSPTASSTARSAASPTA